MADETEKKRTRILMVRLSAEEGQLLDACATEDALPLGTWLRSIAVKEARARAKKRG